MTRPAAPPAVLAPLWEHPERAGVLTDYDGTLAPIVDDPAAARPLDGVAEVLERLADRYRRVAVLSGRPVAFLESVLPHSIVLAGLYGLEISDRGERHDHPLGGAWREVVDDVAAVADATGPAGMQLERKGLSLTLHYRTHPEAATQVREWAERQSARSGLQLRDARMSYELHPPIDASKGTAMLDLASELSSVCYLGDDRGDLPAFDALDTLADRGLQVVRVAVRSDEVPSDLVTRADLVVDGPDGTMAVLRELADRA